VRVYAKDVGKVKKLDDIYAPLADLNSRDGSL
jgi:hypothetical protein